VVIPVYNSQESLSELIRSLNETLKAHCEVWEIILVNDGSTDESWSRIKKLSDNCDQLIGINLRRNFGQDNAIMAGLKFASGESIVIMDAFMHFMDTEPEITGSINLAETVASPIRRQASAYELNWLY